MYKPIDSRQQTHVKSMDVPMAKRQRADWPVFTMYKNFCDRLRREKLLVIMAEADSGKSTQLPQYAAECFPEGLVACLLPHAMMAQTMARRVAAEYDGSTEGNSVGYQVSHGGPHENGNVFGANIVFMTDSVLMHEFQLDPTLRRIRVLIIDEVHQRSLNTDMAMGIANLLLDQRTDDFSVVLLLPTDIDPLPFLNFFGRSSSPPLNVAHHVHPVTVDNLPAPADCPDYKFIEQHLIPIVYRLFTEHAGHTLVFLPTQRDIEKALALFQKHLPNRCIALPLYESLPLEEQNQVLQFDDEHPNQRMVVFCTSIAETSLAVKNVQLVVDTGLIRQIRYDSQLHFNVLETVCVSRFSAAKRSDRAGQSKKGHCVQLYPDAELKEDHLEPEIRRASLDLVILQMKRAKLDFSTFPLLTQPDPASLRESLNRLSNLMCIGPQQNITLRGQLLAELAIYPLLSAFLVSIYTEERDGLRLLSLAATIVAILLNDPRPVTMSPETSEWSSDLFQLYKTFNAWNVVGTMNPTTEKCTTCRRAFPERSTTCQSCRAQYALMNGLNYQILQHVQYTVAFFVKTITDARWQLATAKQATGGHSNDSEVVGKHLRRLFSAQLGHLLVPHLPDEGIRLMEGNVRASIASRSIYVQRVHDPQQQYFVALLINRSHSGKLVVDLLHQISADHLPESPMQPLLVRDNIGWSISNTLWTLFKGIRTEPWAKWLVYDYDRLSSRLTIWGFETDRTRLEATFQPMLTDAHSRAIQYGPIRATFTNGLVCSSIEIIENALRINLQRVPCRSYEKLQHWLKAKLDINRHDEKENNFQECTTRGSDDDDDDDDDDGYEAPPFYIVLRSAEAFQRATTRLPPHYICPQENLSSSTTGAHMSEKDAWGRQLVLTVPTNSAFMTAKEILNQLTTYALDCRPFGERGRRFQPAVQLTNLPRDADDLFLGQMLQPISPVQISLRQTHKDGTGSSSARVIFADDQQCQQAITILQAGLCHQAIQITVRSRGSHQLVQKSVTPILTVLKGSERVPQTFLITASNRESALKMYKEIIPKIQPSWQIDSSATVTVTHPHLYPDFDQFIAQVASRFKSQVQQQHIDGKHAKGRGMIRCFFNHGTPQQTALAATMLAQATTPIIIKMSNDRQKQLFDELFSCGLIQQWSDKLKLELTRKDRSDILVEIRGPQVQQGQLMRQIADYSDTFDKRFHVLELNSTTANFFGRKKLADIQLQNLVDTWTPRGCHVTYIPRKNSIIIYALPETPLTAMDLCEADIKQILSQLSRDGNIIRKKETCVFCGQMSYSTNTFRVCGHSYCRCASTFLAQTFPLQCHRSDCKKNISLADVSEIFPEREEFMRVCKKSLQIYLKDHANVHDQLCCPSQMCDGLIKRSRGYQTCLTCGHDVCPSCALIDDDLHQGRTCAERAIVHKMGDFFPSLFKAAEKFARDNWAAPVPPIIRIDYNTALVDQCLSLKRFHKGLENLGHPLPPDLGRGFFAFHGTAATSIKPICVNGFDPSRRAGQACGIGEYFGVTAAVSHGYCRPANPQGPYSMIIAFLLNCPQLSTRPGFCHVMNNPRDWSYALNLPVVVVSYGTQSTCQSPLST